MLSILELIIKHTTLSVQKRPALEIMAEAWHISAKAGGDQRAILLSDEDLAQQLYKQFEARINM